MGRPVDAHRHTHRRRPGPLASRLGALTCGVGGQELPWKRICLVASTRCLPGTRLYLATGGWPRGEVRGWLFHRPRAAGCRAGGRVRSRGCIHSVACRARHASPSCKPRLASLPTPSLEACRAGHGPGSLPRRTWWLPRAHGAAVVYAPGQRAAQAALGICTRRSGGGEGRGPSRQFRLHGDGRGAHVRRGDGGGHVGGRCPRTRRARRAGRAGRRALARQACAGRAAWLGCACVARERGAAQAADADAGAAGGLFPPGAGQSDWAGAVAGGRPRGNGIEMGSMGPSRQPGAGSRGPAVGRQARVPGSR